jgi:hypothetical protein
MKFKHISNIAILDLPLNSLYAFRTLLIGAASLALAACGGGGGGSATSFTVTASAGANGSVSAATTTVASGATTSLELTPYSNYTVDSASGCGGSLAGNTYTTGPITTDCTVTISFRTREFVWKGGSTTEAALADYGVKGVAAVTNVPGARDTGVSWTDADGKMWLFGGVGYTASGGGRLNDLWQYDSAIGQWTWMHGSDTANAAGDYGVLGVAAASNVPGARSSAVSWTDTDGGLWLFGGMDQNFETLNDLWKYDPASAQWTWMSGSSVADAAGVYRVQGVEDSGNVPGARRSAAAWTDASGNLWLFGGMDTLNNNYNDLWKYNFTSGQWTWMSGASSAQATSDYGVQGVAAASNVPGARTGSVAWTDASGKLWLFGGYGYDASSAGLLNDLWRYDPDNGQWTWMNGSNTVGSTGVYGVLDVPAAGNVPGGRYDCMSWVDADGNPWLLGGYNDSDVLNDLWSYN